LFAIAAAVPQLLTEGSPTAIDPRNSSLPPVFADGGSWAHVLGTDEAGRDILTRIVYGSRSAAEIVLLTLVFGGGLGVLVGLAAGYYGRLTDVLSMRLVDMSLAFPSVLIALMVAAVSGPSFWLVVGATSFVMWARFARLARGVALSLKERDYVALARVAGRSESSIISRHILPNALSSIVVLCTLEAGWIIIIASSLSYLGAGIPPPEPSWGEMVSSGRPLLETAWWISTCPAVAIALVVFAFNSLGDWLRDELDPRLRNLA